MPYAVGTWVSWSAQGKEVVASKKRSGEIIGIVKPGQKFWQAIQEYGIDPDQYQSTTGSSGKPRDHESYIVAVPPEKGHGTKRRLCWPNTTALRKAIRPD